MRFWGLSTCDTTRQALKALRAAGHAPEVVYVREAGLAPATIAEMIAALGEKVLNKASTTFRDLPADRKAWPAAAVLAAHPVTMKRPVIEAGGVWTMGWDAGAQARWLGGPDA